MRVGLLFVPELDEGTSQRLRQLLHEAEGMFFVMLERAAASQRNWIEETLRQWSDEEELDVILTVGGTLPAPGPSSLEIVPEATSAIIERTLPGLSEAMRALAQERTMLALLDRGTAGIRGRTLIVNLPEGEEAASFFLEAIIDSIEPICLHLREYAQAPRLADAMKTTADFSPAGAAIVQRDEAEEMPAEPLNSKLDAQEFADFLRRSPSSGD